MTNATNINHTNNKFIIQMPKPAFVAPADPAELLPNHPAIASDEYEDLLALLPQEIANLFPADYKRQPAYRLPSGQIAYARVCYNSRNEIFLEIAEDFVYVTGSESDAAIALLHELAHLFCVTGTDLQQRYRQLGGGDQTDHHATWATIFFALCARSGYALSMMPSNPWRGHAAYAIGWQNLDIYSVWNRGAALAAMDFEAFLKEVDGMAKRQDKQTAWTLRKPWFVGIGGCAVVVVTVVVPGARAAMAAAGML